MANNTTNGFKVHKQNIVVNTTTAGGTDGATLQDHFSWLGTFTALTGGGPVTVTEPNVTANSVIVITLKTVGGTVGSPPIIKTITPGTGFTVSNTASDTSIYNYLCINAG